MENVMKIIIGAITAAVVGFAGVGVGVTPIETDWHTVAPSTYELTKHKQRPDKKRVRILSLDTGAFDTFKKAKMQKTTAPKSRVGPVTVQHRSSR